MLNVPNFGNNLGLTIKIVLFLSWIKKVQYRLTQKFFAAMMKVNKNGTNYYNEFRVQTADISFGILKF